MSEFTLKDIFKDPILLNMDTPFRFDEFGILGLEKLIKDEQIAPTLKNFIEQGKLLVQEGQKTYIELMEKELISLGVIIEQPEKIAFYLYKYRKYVVDMFSDCRKIIELLGREYSYCFSCGGESGGYCDFVFRVLKKNEPEKYIERREFIEKYLPDHFDKYSEAEDKFSFYVMFNQYFSH